MNILASKNALCCLRNTRNDRLGIDRFADEALDLLSQVTTLAIQLICVSKQLQRISVLSCSYKVPYSDASLSQYALQIFCR